MKTDGNDDELLGEDELFRSAMADTRDRRVLDEDRLFLDAMRCDSSEPGPRAANDARPAAQEGLHLDPAEAQRLDSEDQFFLDAISNAPTVAPTARTQASTPTRVESSHLLAGARRTLLRRVRQGELLPERSLNLHGLTQSGARQTLGTFVSSCRRDGLRLVLIVTGRGLHSKDGPVLRDRVPTWLRADCGSDVQELVKAPPSLGGEGALLVVLRPS